MFLVEVYIMKTTTIYIAIASLAAGATLHAQQRSIPFGHLPSQVQKSFQKELGARFNRPVTERVVNGQLVYEAQSTVPGQTKTFQFDSNGQPLAPVPAVTPPPAPTGTASSAPLVAPEKVTLSGAAKVQFSQLPPEVQHLVMSRTAGSRIEDIDRGTADGETVYQVAFKDAGNHIELQVAEDGTWMFDPRLMASTPPAVAVAAPTPPQPSHPVSISGGNKIQLSQAPNAVQQVIQQRSDGAAIEDLERGTWQGKPVYEAAFKSNGQHVELQVAEDGSVLHDPRLQPPAAVGAPPATQSGVASSQEAKKTMTKEQWKQLKDQRKAQKRAEKEQRKLNR